MPSDDSCTFINGMAHDTSSLTDKTVIQTGAVCLGWEKKGAEYTQSLCDWEYARTPDLVFVLTAISEANV